MHLPWVTERIDPSQAPKRHLIVVPRDSGSRTRSSRRVLSFFIRNRAQVADMVKPKPYTAGGLIPTVRGIRSRRDIKVNLEHVKHLARAATLLSSLDLPVRLIALPEGALQGFNDEILELDQVQFARRCAIDVPGEETDVLGNLAKTYNAFVIAQAKARHAEI